MALWCCDQTSGVSRVSEWPGSRDGGSARAGGHAVVHYPTKHVVGVLDTPELVRAAVATLAADGFADSDVAVACGPAAGADGKPET